MKTPIINCVPLSIKAEDIRNYDESLYNTLWYLFQEYGFELTINTFQKVVCEIEYLATDEGEEE